MPVDFKKKIQNLKNKNAREMPKDLADMKKEADLMKELKLKPVRDADYAFLKEGERGKEFNTPIICMNPELKLYTLQGGFKDVKTDDSKFSRSQTDNISEFLHKFQKMMAKSPKQDEAPKETTNEEAKVEQ